MATIKIVDGTGEAAPRRLTARLGWFVVIWALSTVAFFAGASLLHLLVPR